MDFVISCGFRKDLNQTLLAHMDCVGHNSGTCASSLGSQGTSSFCCWSMNWVTLAYYMPHTHLHPGCNMWNWERVFCSHKLDFF